MEDTRDVESINAKKHVIRGQLSQTFCYNMEHKNVTVFV